MTGGKSVTISHLLASTSKETLGIFTCPAGDSTSKLTLMAEKTQDYLERVKEGSHCHRDIWFLLDKQL